MAASTDGPDNQRSRALPIPCRAWWIDRIETTVYGTPEKTFFPTFEWEFDFMAPYTGPRIVGPILVLPQKP